MTHMTASERERARIEAAKWCARVNGGGDCPPDPEFERWLAENPLNRQLFSEMSELYRFGAKLGTTSGRPALLEMQEKARIGLRLSKVGGWAVLALALSVAGAAVIIAASRAMPEILQGTNANHPVELASVGAKRTFRLVDGSTVTLDAGSRVIVEMDGRDRLLRLERGRARFEVAHDGRPFVVNAGRGSVRALGTIFDVSIMADQSVHVELLRGAVEVSSIASSTDGTIEAHKRLAAGQSAAFNARGTMMEPAVAGSGVAKLWPEGMMTFKGDRLEVVVAYANRYSEGGPPLSVGDDDAAQRVVYGTLKIDDHLQLARVVARSLDLKMTVSQDEIMLSKK